MTRILPVLCAGALAAAGANAAAETDRAATTRAVVSPATKARDAKVAAAVEKLSPAMIGARQRIHQNPELGNREQETAKLVAEHLTALGLEVKTGIAHTGIVASMKGGKEIGRASCRERVYDDV